MDRSRSAEAFLVYHHASVHSHDHLLTLDGCHVSTRSSSLWAEIVPLNHPRSAMLL